MRSPVSNALILFLLEAALHLLVCPGISSYCYIWQMDLYIVWKKVGDTQHLLTIVFVIRSTNGTSVAPGLFFKWVRAQGRIPDVPCIPPKFLESRQYSLKEGCLRRRLDPVRTALRGSRKNRSQLCGANFRLPRLSDCRPWPTWASEQHKTPRISHLNRYVKWVTRLSDRLTHLQLEHLWCCNG